ncbi:hypothetical protein GC722_08715 [Auraticoccus sp. F435]|uniref:Activator of Hsp90 ATPase homologue 1/2-like C-terminal domain-containing protein n=1 Tax=Auraticoccus cholistanensis TaxID=2656650 RepID=A0A6A9UWT3_9ACTN|nr:SRPBCC family protein [Auraticoccus cholistanensis]MVA76102.1 hypothetical protein [Auraticoccus cholistanensis]
MIDISSQIGAVTRTVRPGGERDGVATTAVTASQTYPVPAEEVWHALTDPERLPRWFMPVSGDLRPGGRFQLEGNAGGEVLGCEPPRRLSITWEFGEVVSWVDVTLTEDGGRTVLELVHTSPSEDDHTRRYGPGAAGVGWDLSLMGLSLHLTTGAGVVPEEVQAWAVSAEGQEFMVASARAWGAAAVAGGEDEATARAAAERTTAFYLGQEPPAPVGPEATDVRPA